jgi:hypothetical protein
MRAELGPNPKVESDFYSDVEAMKKDVRFL